MSEIDYNPTIVITEQQYERLKREISELETSRILRIISDFLTNPKMGTEFHFTYESPDIVACLACIAYIYKERLGKKDAI